MPRSHAHAVRGRFVLLQGFFKRFGKNFFRLPLTGDAALLIPWLNSNCCWETWLGRCARWRSC